jgi:hypothetical protein
MMQREIIIDMRQMMIHEMRTLHWLDAAFDHLCREPGFQYVGRYEAYLDRLTNADLLARFKTLIIRSENCSYPPS